MTGGWGEPDQEGTPENGEGISSTRNIAEGVTLEINGDVVTAVMRSPELREHLWRIADQLAAEANQLAVHVGEANRPDPEYRAYGAQVHPANFQARLDEAQHSTLHKVIARHISDGE
jgi:hypothetical protein